MDTKQKTCQDSIGEHLDSRLEDIKEALSNEEARESFDNQILSIDKQTIFRVCLSWGGPADYFDVTVDTENREITKISYVFQDWFDGAERELKGKEFKVVEQIFDYLVEM